jgi:hypothetical protein
MQGAGLLKKELSCASEASRSHIPGGLLDERKNALGGGEAQACWRRPEARTARTGPCVAGYLLASLRGSGVGSTHLQARVHGCRPGRGCLAPPARPVPNWQSRRRGVGTGPWTGDGLEYRRLRLAEHVGVELMLAEQVTGLAGRPAQDSSDDLSHARKPANGNARAARAQPLLSHSGQTACSR